MIKSRSSAQKTTALSSAEAELTAAVKGSCELPHGTGAKAKRIAVFASGEQAKAVQADDVVVGLRPCIRFFLIRMGLLLYLYSHTLLSIGFINLERFIILLFLY